MRATGLFFLRMNAFVRYDATSRAAVGVTLPVVEREKNEAGQWVAVNTLMATWRGQHALDFLNAHRTELRPGRPLTLEFDRLYGRDGEWQGNVTRLELAPLAPSWTKGETDQQPRAASPA